ncbi:ABC transporter permease OS=Streptomyces tendae OX=1932 GN=GUR47_31420 PE=3 SV=1 [Streptomyces tendae]
MSPLTSLDGLAAKPARAASGTRLAVRRFLRNRLAVVGLGVVVFFVLFCFVGPLIHSTDQTHTLLQQVNQSPSAANCPAASASA